MIKAYTGETIKIDNEIFDPSDDPEIQIPADLTGAVVKFAMKASTSDEIVEKVCSIADNKITVRLESSDTLIAGKYRCEMRMKLNGDTESVMNDEISLKDAILKQI